jgi:hypothetical protein
VLVGSYVETLNRFALQAVAQPRVGEHIVVQIEDLESESLSSIWE